MIVVSIVAIVTELLIVLAFVFIPFLLQQHLYCQLLIYTQQSTFVVSIMTWMVTIHPQELMVRDSAVQALGGGQTYECGPLDFYQVLIP
jgi:hypothetical protein